MNDEAGEVGGPGTAVTKATRREVAPPDLKEPTDLVRYALELGISESDKGVEVLERVVDLVERLDRNAARKAYFEALRRFRELCPPIPHDKEAKVVGEKGNFRYTYASLSRIAETVAEPLAECGLSYTWDTAVSGELVKATAKIRHVLGHVEEADFTVPSTSRAGMSPQQKYGAAATYAKRQSLIAGLGLTTADVDDDPRHDPGSAEPITEAEALHLEEEAKAAGVDLKAFLAYLDADTFAEIPAHRFDDAKRSIETRKATNARKARKAGS